MEAAYKDTLDAVLQVQKSHELSIIKLSEPLAGVLGESSAQRVSDVSADVLDNPTPASLEVDLVHYKELFSKLRFSYLEQVAKEKFIRAIVGDPPLVVEHQENVDLEESLAISKVSLKSRKTEVAQLIEELERKGREICRKYENVQIQIKQLHELPERVEGLQESIGRLKAAHQPGSHPSLNMSLDKTLGLVEERQRERAELDRQLEQLQSTLPRKTRELERLNAELQSLEVKRLRSTAAAKEAKRRKEEALGGVGDDLEERGKWWRGVESGLKGMLDIQT